MTITFTKLLNDIALANGDVLGATWARVTYIMPWAKEAMLAFPILRPIDESYTIAVTATHIITLGTNYREIISVEYPIGAEPPTYLTRKNRLDPHFYDSDDHYDLERDFSAGVGWCIYTSKLLPVGARVTVQYLANHATALDDDSSDTITVPDEYEHILIAYVLVKCYRERLSYAMQDPTAHTSVIQQMTEMVEHMEHSYSELVAAAVAKITDSRFSPQHQVDKYDRVY